MTNVNRREEGARGRSDDASEGSERWCILELSPEDCGGVRGVFCSAGECGIAGQWVDSEGIQPSTSLTSFLCSAMRHHATKKREAKGMRRLKKNEKRKRKRESSTYTDANADANADTNAVINTDPNTAVPRQAASPCPLSPQLGLLRALQSRLLQSHSEAGSMLSRLQVQGAALLSLRGLLQEWSLTYSHPSTRIVLAGRPDYSSVTAGRKEVLVPLFPSNALPSPGIASTRPLQSQKGCTLFTLPPTQRRVELVKQSLRSDLSASSTPTGDENVGIVGSLARVVPGTRGRQVVLVLAIKNNRRVGALHALTIHASVLHPESSSPTVQTASGVAQIVLPGEVSFITAHLELRGSCSPSGAGWPEWSQDVEQVMYLAGHAQETRSEQTHSTALALALSVLLHVSVSYQLDATGRRHASLPGRSVRSAIASQENAGDYTRLEASFDICHSCSDSVTNNISSSSSGVNSVSSPRGSSRGNYSGLGSQDKRSLESGTGRGGRNYSSDVGVVVVPPLGAAPGCSNGDMGDAEALWHARATIALHPLQVVRCFAEKEGSAGASLGETTLWRSLASLLSLSEKEGLECEVSSFLAERSITLREGDVNPAVSLLRDMHIPFVDLRHIPSLESGAAESGGARKVDPIRGRFMELVLGECTGRQCSPCVALVSSLSDSPVCRGDGSDSEGDELDLTNSCDDDDHCSNKSRGGGREVKGNAVVVTLLGLQEEDIHPTIDGLRYRLALLSRPFHGAPPGPSRLHVYHARTEQRAAHHCALVGQLAAGCLLQELGRVAMAWRRMNLQQQSGGTRSGSSGEEGERDLTPTPVGEELQLGPFLHLPLQKGGELMKTLQCQRRVDLAVAVMLLALARL